MHKSLPRELFVIVFKAATVVVTLVVLIVSVGALYDVETEVGDGACNVAVFPIEGVILPYYGIIEAPLITTPAMVDEFMNRVEQQSEIKAVLVEINSPGGTPVAAERIAKRIHDSSLPSVGLIGDIGASGGYLVAAATNYLVASPMSEVGSIGVTMSYLENSKKNEEEGLTYVELSTGEFKDSGSPDKPLSEAERAMFEKDLEVIHKEFITQVAGYRNKSFEDISALADGSAMTGQRAKDSGLIDAVGSRLEAKDALGTLIGVDPSEVIFCEYEPPLIPF